MISILMAQAILNLVTEFNCSILFEVKTTLALSPTGKLSLLVIKIKASEFQGNFKKSLLPGRLPQTLRGTEESFLASITSFAGIECNLVQLLLYFAHQFVLVSIFNH